MSGEVFRNKLANYLSNRVIYMLIPALAEDMYLAKLQDKIDFSIDAFIKAYKVIESCQTPEQIGLARQYVNILEARIAPRILPICQVLHTLLTIRLGEIAPKE